MQKYLPYTIFRKTISPLPQTLTPRPLNRTKQILNNSALPGLDLRRDIHPRRQLDLFTVHINAGLAELEQSREDRPALLVIHRVLRHLVHAGLHRAVAGEGKRLQLDGHVLPRRCKPDVLVLQRDLGTHAGGNTEPVAA